jgi:hypothetical protein
MAYGVSFFLNGTYVVAGQEMEFWRIKVLTLGEREDGIPLPEPKDVKVR